MEEQDPANSNLVDLSSAEIPIPIKNQEEVQEEVKEEDNEIAQSEQDKHNSAETKPPTGISSNLELRDTNISVSKTVSEEDIDHFHKMASYAKVDPSKRGYDSFTLKEALNQVSSLNDLASLPSLQELYNLVRAKSASQIQKEKEEQEVAEKKIKEVEEENNRKMKIEEQDRLLKMRVDKDELLNRFQTLLDRRDKAKLKNSSLQHRLGEYFKRKRADESNRDSDRSGSDWDQRYANNLQTLAELRIKFDQIASSNNKVVVDLKQELETKRAETEGYEKDFLRARKNALCSSENGRTGKKLPPKEVIEALELADSKKTQEVVAIRLEYIKLKNKIKRQEQILKQREDLGEGLHLIDFEQLKIENQAYNEKIEERNEEILKLKRKITVIVQILTHIKEKLNYIEGDNERRNADLQVLDSKANELKDRLPILKMKRDSLRAHNTLLRQKNGLLGNRDLLRDYENKKDNCEKLQKDVKQLKDNYEFLTSKHNEVKRQIQKIQIKHRVGNFGLLQSV
ncbi:DUF4201 domain-containing protein [Rozella allomycis CSF55]|uniref:DUF4201 domain-containing protein n=1 Tax=Rozella allomycis (strain CSF55) TaxID=988480 RepID=A0A075B3E6_ROZAC|nr:DUF4201 domain-containing protein [Rozella allomycis CSF55]|eukprot:EPZ36886.1 DUF4201 domain-containing protein [Rozella allomycis CSF55]